MAYCQIFGTSNLTTDSDEGISIFEYERSFHKEKATESDYHLNLLGNLQTSGSTSTVEESTEAICSDFTLDLETGVLSKPFPQQFSFFLMGLGGSVLAILGVMANLIVLSQLVSYRHQLQPRYSYIVAMNIWDNSLLISGWIALCMPMLIGRGQLVTSGYLVIAYSYAHVVMHVVLMGVVWLMVVISTERCMTVYPSWKSYIRHIKHRSSISLACVTGMAVVFNICRAFEIRFTTCCDLNELKSIPEAVRAEFASPGTTYFIWYRTVAKSCCVTVGPFLILLVITRLILRKVGSFSKLLELGFGDPTRPLSSMSKTTGTCTITTASVCGHRQSTVSQRFSKTRWSKRTSRAMVLILLKFLGSYTLCAINDIIECILVTPTTPKQSWGTLQESTDNLGQDSTPAAANTWYLTYLVDIANFLVMAHSATNGVLFMHLSKRQLSSKPDNSNKLPYNKKSDTADAARDDRDSKHEEFKCLELISDNPQMNESILHSDKWTSIQL